MNLRLYRLDIPFTTTFRHSAAERSATQSVWVEARADDVVGVGEGCPREYVTGEDVASAEAFFARHRSALCRDVRSIDTLRAWVEGHADTIDADPAAWCAVELALLDLFARQAGVPVEHLLGTAPVTGTFRYSAVLGDAEAETFRATVGRYRALGFDDFKLKLSGDLTRDAGKIQTLRDLQAPERLRVRVDANNLWDDPDAAVQHLTRLDYPFAGIEEPLPANALDGMRTVSARTGCPIILDESFRRVDQLPTIAGEPGRWIINVRVSKMGGVLRSLALVRAARNARMPIIVGAQVGETSVLTRAGLTVARAADGGLLAQEGAFGTHLLKTDVALRPLMFGRAGGLDADAYELSASAGWGLALRPDRAFAVPLC